MRCELCITGCVYPGSLNLALDCEFSWFDSGYAPHIISFDRTEYGGERDIMLLSCDLNVPDRQRHGTLAARRVF